MLTVNVIALEAKFTTATRILWHYHHAIAFLNLLRPGNFNYFTCGFMANVDAVFSPFICSVFSTHGSGFNLYNSVIVKTPGYRNINYSYTFFSFNNNSFHLHSMLRKTFK